MIRWSDDQMIMMIMMIRRPGWSDDQMIGWSDNHDDQMIMTIMNDQSIRGSANSTSLNVDIYTGFLQYKKSINVFEGRRRWGGRGWGERGKPGGESQTSFTCFFCYAHLGINLPSFRLWPRHHGLWWTRWWRVQLSGRSQKPSCQGLSLQALLRRRVSFPLIIVITANYCYYFLL